MDSTPNKSKTDVEDVDDEVASGGIKNLTVETSNLANLAPVEQLSKGLHELKEPHLEDITDTTSRTEAEVDNEDWEGAWGFQNLTVETSNLANLAPVEQLSEGLHELKEPHLADFTDTLSRTEAKVDNIEDWEGAWGLVDNITVDTSEFENLSLKQLIEGLPKFNEPPLAEIPDSLNEPSPHLVKLSLMADAFASENIKELDLMIEQVERNREKLLAIKKQADSINERTTMLIKTNFESELDTVVQEIVQNEEHEPAGASSSSA